MSPRPTAGGLRRLSAVAIACASLVAAAGLASVFLRTAIHAWRATASAGPAGPADGILLVTGLVGALLTLWLGLGTALSALSDLPGAMGDLCRELAARVAPAAVRKGVAFVLGTSLTAAFIPGTAVAELSHQARPGVVAMGSVGSGDTSGYALKNMTARGTVEAVPAKIGMASLTDGAPDASFRFVAEHAFPGDRSKPALAADAAPSPAWSPEGSVNTLDVHHVVVLRGDTLWSIAARHLGPEAGAAAIDAEWRRWFTVNREVIGEDANRILPGQLLTPPASTQWPGRTNARATPQTTPRAGS